MDAFVKGLCDGILFLGIIGAIGLMLSPFTYILMPLLELLAWVAVIAIIVMIIGSILNSSL